MIALLSAWLIGYALGRVWRPARKQKPARFSHSRVSRYSHIGGRVEYCDAPPWEAKDAVRDISNLYTAQDSTK